MTCNFLNTTFDDKIGTYCGKPGVFFNGRKVRCLDCKDAVWPTERYVCRRIMKMGARRNLPCGKMTVFADGFCSHCRRTYPDLVTHEPAPVEHHIIRDRETGVTRICKVVEEDVIDFDVTDEPSKVVDLTNEPPKIVDITNDDDESSDEPDDSKDECYVPGEESESESLEVYHEKRVSKDVEAAKEEAMTDSYVGYVDGELLVVRVDGTKEYRNEKWQIHRANDLPAVINSEIQAWYKEGNLHRDGGKPAVTLIDGTPLEWWVDGVQMRRPTKPAFDACQTLVGEATLVGGGEAQLDALIENASNAAAAAKHQAANVVKKLNMIEPMCSMCNRTKGRLPYPNPNDNRLLCVTCHLYELFKQIRQDPMYYVLSHKEKRDWNAYVQGSYEYLYL